jgi:hypothetical protein
LHNAIARKEIKKMNDFASFSNTVSYNVQFTQLKKTMLNYPCEKIIINAATKTGSEPAKTIRYEIWATKNIQPAISVNAILLFSEALLTGYTALEIKEILPDAANSYGLTTATEIIEK